MRTTAVLLADHATVREGLLNVLSGGINRLCRDPLPASMDVVVAIMLQPADTADLEISHRLEVVVTHAGDEAAVAKAVMTMSPIGPGAGLLPNIPVVVPLQSVPITATGAHRVTVILDDETAGVLEFEVVKGTSPEVS